MTQAPDKIIEIQHVKNYLGGHWVHEDLNLDIFRNEIIAIIGSSGCGKTTLLNSILMLRAFSGGVIKVFGVNIANCSDREANLVRQRWGVMFQSGALFSSLCVLENVMFPMQEFSRLNNEQQKELALLKLALAGLELEAAIKYPSELSGGMKKRAALARAIALDPELVFLDEPTAGLDPKSAGELDNLVLHLRESLGLTFVMVTHDLDTLWKVPDRVVFMGEGKILAAEPMATLVKNEHPLIQNYFKSARAKEREREHLQGAQGGN